MEFNPILRREVRARWRRLPAFTVVFGYAVLLAIVLGFIYANTAKDQTFSPIASRQSSGALGHQIFSTLAWIQTLGWMLFAPLLTATAITSERESGLLELLQLSSLTPLRIVAGKLLSVLSFIALMLLVPLPIIAICFQLGGVSPGELCETFLLHAATATTGAVVGLNCSAWCRRTTTALGAVVGFIIGLNGACLYFGPILWFAHPLVATFSIFNDDLGFGSWAGSIIIQAGLSSLLLWNASTALLRPLPDYAAPTPLFDATGLQIAPLPPDTSRTPSPASPTAATAEEAMESQPPVQSSDRAIPPLGVYFPFVRWWQAPLTLGWHFANPVLQREVQHKFRFKQESAYGQFDPLPVSLVVLLSFFLFIEILLFITDLINPAVRAGAWWVHAYLWLFGVVVAAAFMGAQAFAREREAGLLEPLLLSSLTPFEIMTGKLLAPLIACGYYSLPVLLAMSLSIDILPGFTTGVSALQAVGTVSIIAATAWCYTALGLFLSWFCKRLSIAFTWTLLTLFGLLLCAPLLLHVWSNAIWWHFANPFLAIALIVSDNAPGQVAYNSLCSIAILFGSGCLVLTWLGWAMRYGTRERDHARGTDWHSHKGVQYD